MVEELNKNEQPNWVEEYNNSFKDVYRPTMNKKKEALERAWKNRDFEINKYWSRATYFWAFIAATFAGFIAVNSSKDMDEDLQRHLSFMINCMGIIFSLAWVLVNKGSKYWQENWEKHIDMLEDDVTGPIYKYVLEGRSYSVSSINLLVSYFVALIWFLLGCGKLCTEFKADYSPDPIIIITIVITIIWALIMLICGRTKSNDERKPILFEKRENDTKTPSQLPKPKLNFCKKTKFSLNKFCKVLLK